MTTASAQFAAETASSGEFVRQPNAFTDRVTVDGSGGYPVESGRYHLIVCRACPWAHRSIIVRRLLGLSEHLSLGVVDPIRDERGWRFTTLDDGGRDPVSGAAYLSELYQATDPSSGCPTGWPGSATSSATESPRPTCGCSPRWSASTPSTTATSSAAGRS